MVSVVSTLTSVLSESFLERHDCFIHMNCSIITKIEAFSVKNISIGGIGVLLLFVLVWGLNSGSSPNNVIY